MQTKSFTLFKKIEEKKRINKITTKPVEIQELDDKREKRQHY